MELFQYKKIKRHLPELSIFFVGTLLESIVAWRVYLLGMLKVLVDQNSHLNITRQVIDSLTPGLSQIGFWPPLLHIIMVPAVEVDPLYHTGLAGFVTLLPFFIIAAIFLYKICLLLTKQKIVSIACAFLFLLNPYILYYTSTPMMEVLYMANLFITTYFVINWLQTNKLKYLLFAGVFVSFSSISRFEGILLIPITLGIVITNLITQRKRYYQIEALLIIFSILAMAGFILILCYGYVFGGNPFSFVNSQWSAFNQQRDYFLPTEKNLTVSLKYFLHASYHMLTKPFVFISFFCLPLLLLLKRRLELPAALLLLFSPFIFDYLALFRGNAIIYVSELPPYNVFFNERYGLYWIGFCILVPSLLLGAILNITSKTKLLKIFGIFTVILSFSVLLIYSMLKLYEVAFVDNFSVIKKSAQGYPSKEQIELAVQLRDHYDYGKILMTRALHDFVAVDSKIDLDNYIQESNYKFYNQALERPQLFARWVVMFNPDPTRQDKWATKNEKVSVKWGRSKPFLNFYTLIIENKRERLYKIKDDVVIKYAIDRGYDPKKIPSINSDIRRWNPDEIYTQIIATQKDLRMWKNNTSTSLDKAIRSDLSRFYVKHLKPEYENGYYIDNENEGSSESQSYGLLQSFIAGDKETFANIWSWTKKNLQRDEDRLFSWKFDISGPDKKINIIDKNSATDADTDIAQVLIKAGEKWSNSDYVNEGKSIVRDIWTYETASISGKRLVTAGNWANTTNKIIINPSYFSPAAYRLFSKYDNNHDWMTLINDGYANLTKFSGKELEPRFNSFLPPNWVSINKTDGKIIPFDEKSNSLDYSYDAFRTLWRVALDYKTYPTDSSKDYLESIILFEQDWNKNKKICTIYKKYQETVTCSFDKTTLAGPISLFSITKRTLASDLINRYYLSSDKLVFPKNSSFYEKSWYWFGLSLYSNYINSLIKNSYEEL